MKNILFLTDPIGKPSYAPRLRFICNYLMAQGYSVTVYTEKWEELQFAHSYPIIECTLYHTHLDWFIKSVWSLLTDWKNRYFSMWVQKDTERESYDMVFCTTFSTFPLRAAVEVAHKKRIPLFVDIRDLDEQVPGAQYQMHRSWWLHPFRNWYKNVNIKRRNKVLKQADCITTVSPWHVDFIRQFNPNVHLIYNGYDPSIFYPKDIPSKYFLITYIGRLYEFQSFDLIKRAIRELKLPDCKLNLHLPNKRYIPFSEVGNEIRKSSISLVLTSTNTHGMMTTKFFEALGCEKPILCIPSDKGCLAQAMTETNAGLASDDIDEIKQFILDKYNEWKQNGFTRQPVRNIEQFNRENQAKQFEDLFSHYTCL